MTWAFFANTKRDFGLISELTAKRRFSLQRPHLIEVVGDAVGLDFSDVEICYPSPSTEQQEIENNLR